MSIKSFEKDGRRLMYVPIDIPVELPSVADIVEYHYNHHIVDTNYIDYQETKHIFTRVATRDEHPDWRHWPHQIYNNKDGWKKLVDNYELKFEPEFARKFPSLVNCIKQQPFKQIWSVLLMFQLGKYPGHHDSFDPNLPTEPRRYNVFLTDFDLTTFWIGSNENKQYPKFLKEYPCFAFNNDDVIHGTDPLKGLKIVMGTAGILDNEKHEALLERSLEKFGHMALWE